MTENPLAPSFLDRAISLTIYVSAALVLGAVLALASAAAVAALFNILDFG